MSEAAMLLLGSGVVQEGWRAGGQEGWRVDKSESEESLWGVGGCQMLMVVCGVWCGGDHGGALFQLLWSHRLTPGCLGSAQTH